ncbi:MAG: C40 family peptidase [Syntrophobacteraceae bacterium]
MLFRAVGNRCAVILDSLKLPMSNEQALESLRLKGFKVVSVDILSIARKYIGHAQYVRGVSVSQAPDVIDCSSYTKWLYGHLGVWIPRRSVQQRAYGQPVEISEITALDLIFTTGFKNYYLDGRSDGVGHVGIVTESRTVIHAASKEHGLVETPVESFLIDIKHRGIRRYLPKNSRIITLEIPPGIDIETSDDITWVLVQPS